MSFGISALIPDDIRPDEVLTSTSDLRPCDVMLLMRGDMQYASSAHAPKLQDSNPRSPNRTWRSGSRKGHEPTLRLAFYAPDGAVHRTVV